MSKVYYIVSDFEYVPLRKLYKKEFLDEDSAYDCLLELHLQGYWATRIVSKNKPSKNINERMKDLINKSKEVRESIKSKKNENCDCHSNECKRLKKENNMKKTGKCPSCYGIGKRKGELCSHCIGSGTKDYTDFSYGDLASRINDLRDICHSEALKRGWHSKPRDFGTLIALCHSELSEALEGDRKGLKDKHLLHRDCVEVELADLIIRVMDLCGLKGYDIGNAIIEKHEYNKVRADHDPLVRESVGGKSY